MPIAESLLATEPVLIEACPGAGKTQFALELIYRLVNKGDISRVIIIVPTVAIADGWKRAASVADPCTPCVPLLSTRDWRPVDPIGEGWLGAVSTYQSLFAQAEMFLAHATDPGHRTLVIFDEIHHAAAEGSWGSAGQAAFSASDISVLSLSGTPFRTDRNPIIYVPSEDGRARPHYRYSYDEAINDDACRPVQFVEVRGEAKFRTSDNVTHTVNFNDSAVTEAGSRGRLRAALEWIGSGSIAEKMLEDANRYILSLRQAGDSDAAGLVVCIDCDHAAQVAEHMDQRVTGFRPVVACSRLHDENDPAPANAIRFFRTSHDPWIVAVNMVSEGVDIPRLRVVVYLTNRLTLLSFRQIVGRVVRTDPANVDDHGRVYIPADPRLVGMARHVTDDPDVLPRSIVLVTDINSVLRVRVDDEGTSALVPFEVLGTVGEQGAVFDTQGREAGADLIEYARRFIEREGLGSTDPESLAVLATENPDLMTILLSFKG